MCPVYLRKCVCSQQSMVEIQCNQRPKPQISVWSMVKHLKRAGQSFDLELQL